MQTSLILRIAGISGAFAVILGAFGAHGLKPMLDPASLENWKTASVYHFIHTLALLAVAILPLSPKRKRIGTALFLIGMLCFSGSLYLLSTRSLHQLPVTILGPITPLGGMLLILGWVCLAWPERRE